MTKKDYELIASVIKKHYLELAVLDDQSQIAAVFSLHVLSRYLADALAEQDKRFNRKQFLKDCGIMES